MFIPMPSIQTQIQHYIDTERPAFLDQRLKSLNRALDRTKHEHVASTSGQAVDLRRVVGMFHPDYQGRTWRELCGTPFGDIGSSAMKRMGINLRWLEENPGYYHDHEEKQSWSFIEVDGDLYCNEGAHRTVLGRLLLEARGVPPIARNVVVDEYRAKLQATLRSQGAGDEAHAQLPLWKRLFK